MDMRKESEHWLLQGKEELETAKASLEMKKWFAVAFWCQQAAEKVLKSAFIEKKKESPGTTHSLTYLGRELNIPSELWNSLRDLTKEYYLYRYPDASEDIPYKTYTKEDAEKYIQDCEKIVKWAESQIKE